MTFVNILAYIMDIKTYQARVIDWNVVEYV